MQASDFSALVPECCSEVLDAMYFSSVVDTTRIGTFDDQLADGSHHCFSLRFEGGVRGTFGLHLADSTARTLASNFLGEEESTLSHIEVEEVVGELANMLCGSVVSRVGGGTKFVLSHPEPIAEFLATVHEDILITALKTDDGVITTWITVDDLRAAR